MAKITYFDDIVKDLAKEFDVDYVQMEEICKLNIKYIHKLIKDPEVISIHLPNLGILHFNALRARHNYKVSYIYKKGESIIESQIGIVDRLYTTVKDIAHRRRSYYTIVKRIFFKDREKRKVTGKKEVYKKIENFQNNN